MSLRSAPLLAAVLLACGEGVPSPPAVEPEPVAASEPLSAAAPAAAAGAPASPRWASPTPSASGRPSVLLLGIDGAD